MIDMFGVQVLTRNDNYVVAREISLTIHKLITGFGGSSLKSGGNIVSYITVNSPPTSIGKDSKGRNQWSSHYNLRVQSTNDIHRI